MTGPQAAEPPREDSPARDRALLFARVTIALYLLELLLNLMRPHLSPNEPTLSIFVRDPGASGSLGRLLSMPKAVFWTVVAGIVLGAALQVYARITRPEGRREAALVWATVAVLLGPFALLALTVVFSYPGDALLCVPGTAFVLAVLHLGQRFGRVPLTLLAAAFGWGALIVFGLGRAFSGLALGTIGGYLLPRPTSSGSALDDLNALGGQVRDQFRMIDLAVLHLFVVNALAVAAGVVVLLLLLRHRVVDVVTGFVLGAATGLGCAFVESVLFIRLYGSLTFVNGATGGFEYWIRQSIGLLGGSVLFGALLGGGLALALTGPRENRTRTVLAAFATAVGGTAGSETLAGWLSKITHEHLSAGGTFDTLIASPALWLLPQLPFAVVAVLLLVTGLRARAATARTAILARAEPGGPITSVEAYFLADPPLRLWTLAGTWKRHGPAAALAVYRLQCAQLDLASSDPEAGGPLRAKVMRLKANGLTRAGAAS
ncbi:PrsW family glutamic-type intramembrane protease [Actinomadura harenae]|uniref:PrsW family intramembrane metalloprotease n=1 Tax=Actinomadura harenae TaxID=2483351 RepID=A0A3M2LT80_9ACTN|nr:PrsW family glutamic-type intramembrane protease [Actinomadura harenae]RMI40442.1 PrsW family intramembrane metalloprotease [Actinomadura harenae]